MGDLSIEFLLYIACPVLLLWIWETLSPKFRLRDWRQFSHTLKLTGITLVFFLLATIFFSKVVDTHRFTPLQIFKETVDINSVPVIVRVVLAYFLVDLSSYIFHWYTHNNKVLWKTHRFHHSTEHIWWFSGLRDSFTHLCLQSCLHLWFAVLDLPKDVMVIVTIHICLHNCWQHLNVKRQPWMNVLEWLYVTPSYHDVHHIAKENLYNKNLGAYFTYLDRIFGTYVNPDDVDVAGHNYGLGSDTSVTAPMIIGF